VRQVYAVEDRDYVVGFCELVNKHPDFITTWLPEKAPASKKGRYFPELVLV
jgi:hypothetical protein